MAGIFLFSRSKASDDNIAVIANLICLSKTSIKLVAYSSISIICLFLPNSGRILPVLMEESKIENCPKWGLNPGALDHLY